MRNPPDNSGAPVPSRGGEDPLEGEIAVPSSILAAKSHGQRSLAGELKVGLQRVGQD